MKPKVKAFFYNLISFAVFFLILRFSINFYFPQLNYLVMALAAAFTATLLAPKFGVVKEGASEKILMKWVFLKGIREVK